MRICFRVDARHLGDDDVNTQRGSNKEMGVKFSIAYLSPIDYLSLANSLTPFVIRLVAFVVIDFLLEDVLPCRVPQPEFQCSVILFH